MRKIFPQVYLSGPAKLFKEQKIHTKSLQDGNLFFQEYKQRVKITRKREVNKSFLSGAAYAPERNHGSIRSSGRI